MLTEGGMGCVVMAMGQCYFITRTTRTYGKFYTRTDNQQYNPKRTSVVNSQLDMGLIDPLNGSNCACYSR